MRCPTISELPQPPQGKVGWPWTEETHSLPDPLVFLLNIKCTQKNLNLFNNFLCKLKALKMRMQK